MVAHNSVITSPIRYDLQMTLPSANQGKTVPKALGRIRVALDDAYLRASRELGLTPQQAELLCAAMTPTAVGELAKSLRCDRSNISRLVDRASLRGWVKRNGGEDDGRVSVIELTADGARVARRFLSNLESKTADLVTGWPAGRQQLAVELLDEISDALDTSGTHPPKKRRRMSRRTAGSHTPRSD